LVCGSDYPFDMGVSRPLDLPLGEGIAAEVMEAGARRFLDLPDLRSGDDA
jgi:aminocarboxymuconate-semialdehyde decarboxylase